MKAFLKIFIWKKKKSLCTNLSTTISTLKIIKMLTQQKDSNKTLNSSFLNYKDKLKQVHSEEPTVTES